MKKTAALIRIAALSLALALTLSSCAVSAPLAPHKAELIDEISDEEAPAETASAAVSSSVSDTEAAVETASVTVSSSSSAADPLSRAFENIGSKANLCFGYTSEGEYESIDYEEYISEVYVKYSMEPYSGEKYSQYDMFVEVYYYNDDKEEECDNSAAAKKGFEFFAEKLSEDDTFSVEWLDEYKTIEVHIFKQGDILYVTAKFDTKGSGIIYIADDEPVSLYGEDYVLIGSTAVPADTKSLYIFWESMESAKTYYGYEENSGENEAAVFDYSDTSVDLADIAEKLPDLKKLYISHRIHITGFEGLKKYSGFSELDISTWHIRSENADILAGLSNIKKLRLRNVREKEDIEWTANAKFSELAFECDYPKDEMMKFVYSIPKVTELTIYGSAVDFTGIEAMPKLKKLNIVSAGLDGKQIDDLKGAVPQCKIEVSRPEEKSLAAVYIGDVRIETYDGDDYWNKMLYVKNCGEEPVESLPEFLVKNGFTEGCEELYISYPEHDGIEYSGVTERLQITDKGIDYDNFEMYLSVLSVPDEDYTGNFRYRTLVSGSEVKILLHMKASDSET